MKDYREWKDYDDGLDYEDLISRQGSEDVVNDDHTHKQVGSGRSPLNTIAHIIGGSIGRLLATATVVFAVSILVAVISTNLPNTKGVIPFEVKIGSLADKGVEVIPGTEQDINTPVTNDSGQEMYVFVRLSCETYSDDEGSHPIYSFTPAEDSGWTQVDVGSGGQIVFAYTEYDESQHGYKLSKVSSEDAVPFKGKLTCVIPKKYFADVEDVSVKFDGFGVSTGGNDDPKGVYNSNIRDKY